MKRIAELFEKSIDRTIEEVIKVDQANESAVRTELDEYIVTDSISDQFVYGEIAEGPSRPREGIGMWVSRLSPSSTSRSGWLSSTGLSWARPSSVVRCPNIP